MRAAGTAYPAGTRRYVSFALPGRPAAPVIETPLWSRSGPASIADQVRGTPYVGMYELARRIASGAPTPYEAARRIEVYLRSHYAYRQNVPNRTYPLPAFLSQDHAGYCQQFSGTMALMLRMLGIPSRVSTGFAPGGRDPERNNFLVDDTDAHDWVEVFFPRIGWVTFEPTPAAAPAATQLDDNALGVTKSPTPSEKSSGPGFPQTTGGQAPAPKRSAGVSQAQASHGSGPGALLVLAAVVAALTLGALGAYGLRTSPQAPDGRRSAHRRPGGGAGSGACPDRPPAPSGRHAAHRGGLARRIRGRTGGGLRRRSPRPAVSPSRDVTSGSARTQSPAARPAPSERTAVGPAGARRGSPGRP